MFANINNDQLKIYLQNFEDHFSYYSLHSFRNQIIWCKHWLKTATMITNNTTTNTTNSTTTFPVTTVTTYSEWWWSSLQEGTNNGSSTAYMFLSTLTIIVHVVGLRMLIGSRHSFNANTALIVSLSVCEIIYCVLDLSLDVSVILQNEQVAFLMYFVICCIMIPVQYCMMVLLTGM